jgi:hypothetical protein
MVNYLNCSFSRYTCVRIVIPECTKSFQILILPSTSPNYNPQMINYLQTNSKILNKFR